MTPASPPEEDTILPASVIRRVKQPAETPVSLPASPITNVTPASPPEEDTILPASVMQEIQTTC